MAEIHVGDLGTLYQVPIYDNDLDQENFDPSTAQTKEIHFKMPGVAAAIVRTATIAQVTIDGVATYCLTYEVDPQDDDAEFHIQAGKITIQGFLEYSDGRKWTSNKITTDHQGRVLRVYPNLVPAGSP